MDPGPVFYEALLYILHFSWGDTGAELVRFVSIIYPPPYLSTWAFSGSSAGKESACNTGDLSSIPGLGRSRGKQNSYSLQYSGLENPTDCIVHGVGKKLTQLSDFHFLSREIKEVK